MVLEALAGRVLVAGFPAGPLPIALRRALSEGSLGGIIVFKRNLEEGAAGLASLVRALAKEVSQPVLVGIDQEGGRVARLGAPVLRLPPMRALGDRDDLALTERAGRVLGRQLRALGVTMDFAPVLDVDTNPTNPVIGDRSFGATPERVIRHGLAFAAGLDGSGVSPCGKHFPGHGDTDLDSHLALPILRHDAARLEAVELAPFRAARAFPALMTAHVVFEALDPSVPATLSRRVLGDLLRGHLGYDGAVISDDLEMKALSDRWPVPESAVAAVDAGCDVLLVCRDVDACFAAREALTRCAERDPRFRARLEVAAQRAERLYARARPAPLEGDALAAALTDPEVAALEAALVPGAAGSDPTERP
ncbi:MAG: beta-N-acetylhexosaminidase [Myxococcales bacterium]|nr:beta-N-acetylhexosaminidase [Myxococcales bacterium]